MLQQTRVEAVKPYFERFMAAFPDVASLAEAQDDHLMKMWEGLGYYNRARNLKAAAIQIMDQFDGCIPSSKEELLTLPELAATQPGQSLPLPTGFPIRQWMEMCSV